MRNVVVPALIALAGVLVAALWQYGGYLSGMRRRLMQELEVLSKLPAELAVRQEYEQHVEQLARAYLGWSSQPFSRRILDAFASPAQAAAIRPASVPEASAEPAGAAGQEEKVSRWRDAAELCWAILVAVVWALVLKPVLMIAVAVLLAWAFVRFTGLG